MPLPKPGAGETTPKFISRCISFLHDEGTTGDQAVAMCYSAARQAGRTVPKPKKEDILTLCPDCDAEAVLQKMKELETEEVPMESFPKPPVYPETALGGIYPEIDTSEPLPERLRPFGVRPDELAEELKKP